MPVSETVEEGSISRPTGGALATARIFCVINSSGQIAQATTGGPADGILRYPVSASGDLATIDTLGNPLVLAGGTFSVDDPLMVDSAGKAVLWTFGNVRVGRALAAGSAGNLTRIKFYPHAQDGSQNAEKMVKLALTGAALHAAITLSIVNPEGKDVLITRALVYTTTVSSGAATADTGVTTVSATTVSDTLLDGTNMAVTAPNVQGRLQGDATTNSWDARIWPSGKWVTISELADTTGFVGSLYIFYIIP